MKKWPVYTLLLIVSLVAALGYWNNSEFIGVGSYITPVVEEGREFQRGKTFWDWLEILIVPLLLFLAAESFSESQKEIEDRKIEVSRKQEELKAEELRRQSDYDSYLSQIWDILSDYDDFQKLQTDGFARASMKARTLVLLKNLDPKRKGDIVQYLYESGLIMRGTDVISLKDVDLTNADLEGRFMPGIILADADLSGANLKNAILGGDFKVSGLSAKYDYPKISDKIRNDSGTYLKSSFARANLSGTDLTGAKLDYADFTGVVWRGTVLDGASLKNAIIDDIDELEKNAQIDSNTLLPRNAEAEAVDDEASSSDEQTSASESADV